MILQDIDTRYIRRRDVFGCQSVTTVHKIGTVNIEFIDRLTMVFDLPVLFHLYSRQAFKDIRKILICRCGILTHIVSQRIASLFYVRRRDGYIVELRGPGYEIYGHRRR